MNSDIGQIDERKEILLVEDDPQDAELTTNALEEIHPTHVIIAVRDGEQALDYLFRRGEFKNRAYGNPIVVMLDNKMPKIGGLQVLKAVRADEHLKTVPVVVFSSSQETKDLIEFYKHGVNAYVVKPLEFSEFRNVVRHLGNFWAMINKPPPGRSGV